MTDSNNKTSLLVNSQLPAFIREEHETFVKFMEYYYKFLEQDGEHLYVAKNFMNYLDIDQIKNDIDVDALSGDEHNLREVDDYHNFLQKMYDTYIKYIPDTVLVDKTLIVKHAKEFYRSSGSEKSLRFLIRALFNKEATIYYPKSDILRASDGKWFIEKSLKVKDIMVDSVSNTAAAYNFTNTKIIGAQSNATAIVEKVDIYFDKGQMIYELKLSNIYKEFLNAEGIYTHYTEEGVDKLLSANLFSGVITNVQLVSGGSGYTEGTTVPVTSSSGSGAQIVIASVTKGTIQAAGVVDGGAGFRVDDNLVIIGPGNGASGHLTAVDDSGTYHPNSYNVVSSTIDLVANNVLGNVASNVYESWAYVNLASVYTKYANLTVTTGTGSTTNANISFWKANSNVYFETYDTLNVNNNLVTVVSSNVKNNWITVSPALPGSLSAAGVQVIKRPNANTTIANSMSYFLYANCGPAVSTIIDNGGSNYVPPISIGITANSVIAKLGILGKMKIISGGLNYVAGDVILFDNGPTSSGTGALANVKSVAANGMITAVEFKQMPGHTIGGSGYDWLSPPSANIRSATGSGANIAVTALIGHNEQLIQSVSNVGTIQELTIISGGSGYLDGPVLRLDQFGDGTANALLTTVSGVFSYPGRYITDDGHISGYNFLENRDYYQEFSYVVKVDETINKYRGPIKDLLHPAGTKLFGQYDLVYDKETTTNTNLSISYANTERFGNSLQTLYQVQGYTSGTFVPNTVYGLANAEFIAGSFSLNTSNQTVTYVAQNNTILIYSPTHTFVANQSIFLQFTGSNTWANLANTNYVVSYANSSYIRISNPKTETANGNTGSVKIYHPDVIISMPYNIPNLGNTVYLQFKTPDAYLANGYYNVSSVMSGNTFNVLHPYMTSANDSANVANLITKKITVTANGHSFSAGESAYVLFITGDTANAKNGYYTVSDVGSSNTFNIYSQNVIFSGSVTQTYLKKSKIVINNHPYNNGNLVYISFTSGDQSNTVNGVYQPVKVGTNEFVLNVARPATANAGVRVWYQTNNYSNIVFTTLRTNNGIAATNNVDVEFFSSASDLANGIYMVKNVYGSNTYNIYYNANTYIQNAWSTYHSLVTIPGNVNTINVIAHSGLGVVSNTRMEGPALVSIYK